MFVKRFFEEDSIEKISDNNGAGKVSKAINPRETFYRNCCRNAYCMTSEFIPVNNRIPFFEGKLIYSMTSDSCHRQVMRITWFMV